MDPITQFINQLLAELGFADMATETLNQYNVQFAAELEKRIGLAVQSALSPEQRTAFETLAMSGPSEADVQSFLQSAIPDYESLVAGVLGAFAAEMRRTVAAN